MTDIRMGSINPLLRGTVRERALINGFNLILEDAKYSSVYRRTDLAGRGVHSEVSEMSQRKIETL